MTTSAGTKESELVMAVMLYAIRCLSENDQHALRNMNFGPEEVAALRGSTWPISTGRAVSRRTAWTSSSNRDVYWPMLAHLRRERESEELQRDLIQADAPLEMMRRLFGVGSRGVYGCAACWPLSLRSVARQSPMKRQRTAFGVRCLRVWMPTRVTLSIPNAYLAVHRETGALRCARSGILRNGCWSTAMSMRRAGLGGRSSADGP